MIKKNGLLMNLTGHEMYDWQKVMGLLKDTISDWYYNMDMDFNRELIFSKPTCVLVSPKDTS